jgi:hypothetical protein
MRKRTFLTIACFMSFLASCAPAADEKSGRQPILDGAAIKAHIEKLSSDEMEGRAPGGKGEELATAYISDHFRSIGLKTSFQDVPLVGVTSTVSPMRLTGGGGPRTLKFADEFVAWSKQERESISAGGDLVFAGYGVVAPEYQWNDFKDADI